VEAGAGVGVGVGALITSEEEFVFRRVPAPPLENIVDPP
jgi:hypothetical protein